MTVPLNKSAIADAFRSRPFQKTGTKFAVRNRNVLIADEPGLGKTLQAIAAVIQSGCTGSVLVVAPKTAAYVTWPAELERWLADIAPNDKVRIIGGKLSRRERLGAMHKTLSWDIANDKITRLSNGESLSPVTLGSRQWIIVSPNYLRFNLALDEHKNYVYDENGQKIVIPVREALPSLLAIEWATIIVDEAHQTLAGATGNIKKQSAQSRGIRMLEVADNGMRIALTGTPFRGKHENIWGILNWLEPKKYSSYWEWVKKHFEIYMDYSFGVEVVGQLKSEEKLTQELRSLMIRRSKDNVALDLPRKIYGGTPLSTRKRNVFTNAHDMRPSQTAHNVPVAVWLPMENEQLKAYEEMKRTAMADVEGGTLMANSILAEMIRLKQFANSYGYLFEDTSEFKPMLPSNKFEWILEFLRERGIDGPDPSGNRVVIASQFTKHINMFAAELREHYKINCFVLTGQTNEQDRIKAQREFQSGTTDNGKPSAEVFLLNTHAGGVSLTLDAADDIILVDSTFSPDDQTQVEDRCHRISRMHSLTVWNLCSKGSIDESILRSTYETGLSLKRILDGGDVKQLLGGS